MILTTQGTLQWYARPETIFHFPFFLYIFLGSFPSRPFCPFSPFFETPPLPKFSPFFKLRLKHRGASLITDSHGSHYCEPLPYLLAHCGHGTILRCPPLLVDTRSFGSPAKQRGTDTTFPSGQCWSFRSRPPPTKIRSSFASR